MTTTTDKPVKKASPSTRAQKPAPATEETSSGISIPVLVPALHVHRVTVPRVGLPHVTVPHVTVPHVPGPRAVASRAPSRVLWFGSLAGLAATGVIGWPVASVVAVSTWVAEQQATTAVRNALADVLQQATAVDKPDG